MTMKASAVFWQNVETSVIAIPSNRENLPIIVRGGCRIIRQLNSEIISLRPRKWALKGEAAHKAEGCPIEAVGVARDHTAIAGLELKVSGQCGRD